MSRRFTRPTFGRLTLTELKKPPSTRHDDRVPVRVGDGGAASRMYLPLAALLALFCAGVQSTLRGLSAIPLGLTAVVFIALSVARNADYEREIRLWSDTVAKRPLNARAHGNLSAALLRAHRLPEAIAAAEKATRLRPAFARAHNNLGVLLLDDGDKAAAIRHFESALDLDPGHSSARTNLELAKQRAP